MSFFTPLQNWSLAQRIAQMIRMVPRTYRGHEVVMTLPNGSEVLAVVVDMSWEPSVYSARGELGDWCVRVRIAEGAMYGWETETAPHVLELTGKVYASADDLVMLNSSCVR